MWRIMVCIWGLTWLFLGCAQFHSKEEIVYDNGKLQKFSYLNESQGSRQGDGNSGAFMDAVEVLQKADPTAIPQLADLPALQKKKNETYRRYTGVIKNTTKTEVSVPSLNSGGTLSIPPHGWIEYDAYTKSFDLTVYADGKPFYCLKICANPSQYQYMCKNYDFLAEIVKPEPVVRQSKQGKMKRAIKKKPKVEEEGVKSTS